MLVIVSSFFSVPPPRCTNTRWPSTVHPSYIHLHVLTTVKTTKKKNEPTTMSTTFEMTNRGIYSFVLLRRQFIIIEQTRRSLFAFTALLSLSFCAFSLYFSLEKQMWMAVIRFRSIWLNSTKANNYDGYNHRWRYQRCSCDFQYTIRFVNNDDASTFVHWNWSSNGHGHNTTNGSSGCQSKYSGCSRKYQITERVSYRDSLWSFVT